jgi:hypothetical protein
MAHDTDASEAAVERGAAEDASGAPLTETEIAASHRPPSSAGEDGDRDSSDVTIVDDASGTAGGASGGSGGGSGLAGHPDNVS